MDDRLKQQLMPAIVVFNFTLVAYLLFRVIAPMFGGGKLLFGGLLTHVLIGAGIGLVTGGIMLAISLLLGKR